MLYLTHRCCLNLVLGAKDLVEPNHGESVMDFIFLDPLNSFLQSSLGDINRLHPRLDAILCRQCQQIVHFLMITEVRPCKLRSITSEQESLHLRQALVRQPNHVKLASNLERGEILRHLECVCHVTAVEDKIKLKCMGLGPVLLSRDNSIFCSELLDVLDLTRAVSKGVRFGAQRNSPLEAEVA